ncbi:MAG: flagellar brake protein [Nitrospira sp.]|nr:flagellar brake protein [Nitrospira sp.]
MNEVMASTPSAISILSVGLPLKISLSLDQQKLMYGSTLLGWKEHAWLVCELPSQLSHVTDTLAGTPCTVSYVLDGKLVGYKTEIRDLILSPVPILFLAFPQNVEEMHLRKHTRVASSEPALLTRADFGSHAVSVMSSSDYAGGLVKDLSMGGCSIALTQIPVWLRPGATIHLEFELLGLGHVTNLAGVVKNIEGGTGTDIIGVEFQFDRLEYIEYRGWGGSVRNALEQWTAQKSADMFPIR